ncbi:hypothetical protein BH10PSE7_BH10PSE7_44760 [soil metagenome]
MLPRFAAAFTVALLVVNAPLFAHEGHDQAPPVASPAAGSTRADAVSGNIELVAVADARTLTLFVDDFTTNAPLQGADITVETPSGSLKATQDGAHYRVDAPFLAKPGRFDLIITIAGGSTLEVVPLTLVTSPTHDDASIRLVDHRNLPSWLIIAGVLLLGLVSGYAIARLSRPRTLPVLAALLLLAPWSERAQAHEGHDHAGEKKPALTTSGELAQRLSDGTLYIPKSVQRIFEVRTIVTAPRVFKRSLELPGRIIPDPNASGFVQASVGGRLSAPPGGFPRLGTPVRKGDVLAYVLPPIQQVDISDMRQRQGELDQQLTIVETRLARYTKLSSSGAVPRQLLEEAQIELQGLKDRRAALDKSRREPEALVAPVDGVVADGTPVAGQITQPNAVVYHIVDPTQLWVEALSFAAINPSLASATTADGKTVKLAFRGSGFADRNQSIAVHFAIEGDTAGFRAGQFVTVLAATDEQREGMAVPRAAVVRAANGQDFVFEHIAPERFAARAVRVEPLDGDRVLILAGIDPGKRVTTQGADLLDHVR